MSYSGIQDRNSEITRWLWTCLRRYSTGILKKKKTSNALIANTSFPSTLVCLSKLNTPALPFVLENASNWLKEAIMVPGSTIDFMKVCNYFNWDDRVSIIRSLYTMFKKMSAFYSCFDFEQFPFPLQPNLCTWLACLFSSESILSGDSEDN